MTVYVKTISGKQSESNVAKGRYRIGKIELRTAIPQGFTYLTHQGNALDDKKTIEESNIETETTIEMSLRLLVEEWKNVK